MLQFLLSVLLRPSALVTANVSAAVLCRRHCQSIGEMRVEQLLSLAARHRPSLGHNRRSVVH